MTTILPELASVPNRTAASARDVFGLLLAVLAGGDVTIELRQLGHTISAHDPGTGTIVLNEHATRAEQRAGLADALAALATDLEPARPALRLVPSGAHGGGHT